MSAFAFDTLKAVRTLTDAGMQEPVAEAIVNTMKGAVTEGVATKADVARLESDIAGLRAELKADVARLESGIANLESRVMTEISSTKWALGFIAAVALLMAGRMFGAF